MHRVGRQYVQVSIPHISKEYQKHYKAIDFFDQLAEDILLAAGVTDLGCTFSIGF